MRSLKSASVRSAERRSSQKANFLYNNPLMSTLLTHYRKDVAPALQKHFGIGNMMSVPKITKITVNVGIGKMIKDGKAQEKAERDLALMTGQKAVARKAK